LWLSDTTSVVALTNLEIRGLAPGEYLETSFDLPAGTQPTGTVAYRMAVDEAGEMQDVDRSNNECLFTLTSWREAPEDYRQYRAVASGGTTLVISNDLLGADADITNVLVDGQSAVIRAQGAGWVQVVLPAHTADIVSIHVQSESLGDRLLYRVLGYEDSVSKQWTGATDAQWGNATNWSASGSPGPADVVYFNALATQNLSAVLEGEATALRVVQRNPAGPVTITSTGQILTLGLGLDLTNAQQDLTIEAPLRLSGDQLWSVTNGRTLAVRGPVWADGNAITVTGAGTVVVGGDLVGGASLLKAGSGTLVVTGETSFAAGIAVDAGSLQVGNNTPSGRLHGSVTNKANLYFHRSDGGIMSNSVAGPGITYVKGSVGYGGALSNGQLLVAQDVAGQLCVLDGADVTVSNLYLGNPSYIPGTLIQSGGSVRVWGYPYTMRIGHWQFETSCYTLAGGELNVSPGQLSIGWNGRGVFEVAGGTANVQVLQINANGPFGTTDGGALIMTGGRLNLGAGGMSAPSARAEAYLGGGTLGALASWSDATSAVYTITGTNGNLTVDPGAYTITLNGRFSGTGGLVKVGAGTLVMGGDSTYAGGTQVRGGILQLGTNGTAGHVIGPITNDGVIVFNRTGNTGVTSVISGVGEVVKMGGNRIGLEAGNTYAGRTRVLGGYLCLTNDTGLGAVPDVPVADQLVLDGGMLANMNAAFARPPDHLTLHAHRGVHLGPGHGVFRTAWSSNTYVNGVISGPGRLRKTDGGTLILNAANLHTNATEWVDLGVNFGTIRLGHTQALQYSTLNMYSNASAVLDLNGLDGAVLGGLAGGATNSAIINIPAGSHLQVGNNNSDTTFAGILAGGGLSKIGTGRLTLASAQSYVGPTVISSGVLRVESGLATGVIQVTASGALELPGGSVVGGDLEVSGEVRLLPGDLGVAAAGGSYTQAEGAVFSVELVGSGGPSPTSGCARLGVSGAAHLGGILSVTATGGIWEAGSCLTILTANAISGDFAATNLPVASTGRWVVEKESQKVMLRLQAMTVADVALQGLLQVYSGASRVVTALTTPPDLDVDITYDGNSAAPVNAGTYMVTGVVTEAGYSGGATGILVVQQAVAAVHLVDLDRVYHGGPQSVTATTDPAGLVVVVTYEGGSAPVLAGLYAVTAAVNELNYAGATDGVLRIARAVPSVLWTQPVAVAYGTVLGDNQLNATSDVPGSFLYTPGSGALLPPGLAHPLSARFDPEDAANYTSTTASVLLDVHPTLEATAGVHGAISPSGWIVVPYGSNAEFVVQAQQYFHVASVATNGVPMAGVPVAAVCTVVWENVVATGLVEALFLADLSAQGVPHWWLAGYGWAGELNDAATNDPDQDRMLTWQEFWAGTDPTNRDSFLGMNQAAPAAGGGFVIRWQSVTGRSYAVARSVNLRAQPAFTAIFEHVTGLAGHTSVTDTQADVIGPRVYRVEVEP
jgi:autotransporter-associated beta strand protein